MFIEANGKVPVGGGNKSVFVQHAAELHNRKPILAVTGHGNLAAMVQHVSESLQEQAVSRKVGTMSRFRRS
jgi:hypothetical protein